MRRCEIFSDQELELDLSKFKKICLQVLSSENKVGSVNIVFVDEKRISEYNATYRGVEGPTDVLSFENDLPDFLGEVYVCPTYVQKNASYFGVPFEEELIRVCIHGILHLLGYNHENNEEMARKMFERQEHYVSTFCDSRDSNS